MQENRVLWVVCGNSDYTEFNGGPSVFPFPYVHYFGGNYFFLFS